MAGVVKTTSPIWRSRTRRIFNLRSTTSAIEDWIDYRRSRMSDSAILRFDRCLVDEHDRDVVLDGIHTLAHAAFERGVVLDQRDGGLAVRTRQDLEQFGVYRHGGNI